MKLYCYKKLFPINIIQLLFFLQNYLATKSYRFDIYSSGNTMLKKMKKHFLSFCQSSEILLVVVNEGTAPMVRTYLSGLQVQNSLSCTTKVEILGKEDFYINPGQTISIIFVNTPKLEQLMHSVAKMGFRWHVNLQLVILLHAKVDRSKIPAYASLCWKEKIRAIEPLYKIAVDYVERQ